MIYTTVRPARDYAIEGGRPRVLLNFNCRDVRFVCD